MGHVRALAGMGPRGAGSAAERRAASYLAAKLRSYGYAVTVQTVKIPGGRTSRNVYAQRGGRSSRMIVLGSHMDSKPPSPGGNDNASGCAVTLELARVLADADVAPTVRFVFFGAEEISGATANDHHFGSRTHVKRMSAYDRGRTEAMVSIDMVGYGSVFNVRNLRRAPMTAVSSVQTWARTSGQPLIYLKDPSRTGWSDHEAFEFAGIPVAWLEWRNDPVYHTRKDTAAHVSADRVTRTGRLTRGWLLDLNTSDVAALRP
jgi:Zn-dependent M28 family amino/carboxypeptidase